MKQSYEIIWDLKLPEKLEEAVEKPMQQTVLKAQDLQKELLVLRLAFGKLKAEALSALAPLQAVFARVVTNMVWSATRMVKQFGQVVRALFGISGAGKVVEKTVKKAGKTVQRSLASFDQLNRLQKSPASGTAVTTQTVKPADTKISQEAQAIADKIKAIFAPLQAVDLEPIRWSFARLKEEFENLLTVAGPIVSAFWSDHLAPFLVWIADHLVPVLNYLGNRVLQFLQVAVEQAGKAFLQMLEDMKPLTDFLKLMVLTVFDQARRLFANMRISMEADGSALAELFRSLGTALSAFWECWSGALYKLRAIFADTFQGIGTAVFTAMQAVLRAVSGVIEVIAGILTGDWKMIWSGMGKVCKNAVNAVIGVLNALLSGLTGTLNSVITLFNKLKIKVPDWVPAFGGKEFGFSLKTVKAPQIPYLAKGAVLPANQPFLAMVGDQKHGTNIEAPLSTIQEAVALVLQDQIDAMMAGFQALVQENRRLRQTVEGIEVGDTVIGQAANRYNRRQAVVRGGGL